MNKRVLQVIPYTTLYPAQSGGQLRCFHLMQQLARFKKVDVLVYQPKTNIYENGFSNSNIRFINPQDYRHSEGLFSFLPKRFKIALRYRWLTKTIFESASREVIDFSHIIKALAKEGILYDTIILEHLSALSLSPIIRKHFPNSQIVLNAHNIDYKLITGKILQSKIKRKEEQIFKKADCFFACSQSDASELRTINQNRIDGKVVPNGVDSKHKPFHKNKEGLANKILFCGTLNYEPNKRGLLWFYNKIWPLVCKINENITLTIIGRGDISPFNHFRDDPQIHLVGEVDDVEPYYENSYIAIVPLLTGSGTRLKILEAMSFGNPVVSTSIGIEGIKAENKIHALISDTPIDFADSIISLIQNPNLGENIRLNAYQLVQSKYDWNVIGHELNRLLNE